MSLVCPTPQPWYRVYQSLKDFAANNPCNPSLPPIPLILNGWVYSSDFDKMLRWKKTIEWTRANGCSFIVENIPESDFYSTFEVVQI